MRSAQTSRRQFLQAAGSALAVPYVASVAKGAAARPPAGDRIVMATIGCGGQGTGDMQGFLGFPQVQMVAVCDVVASHRERARNIVNDHYKNKDCKEYGDFRDVLARPDIDAVLIGTPDHWHALVTIEACKHGKDVYCEKPECLTIKEGRAMVDGRRRYGRVFSGGSQRVLGDYGDWYPAWCAAARSARSRRSAPTAGAPRATATSSRSRSPRGGLGHVARPGARGGRSTTASSTAASAPTATSPAAA